MIYLYDQQEFNKKSFSNISEFVQFFSSRKFSLIFNNFFFSQNHSNFWKIKKSSNIAAWKIRGYHEKHFRNTVEKLSVSWRRPTMKPGRLSKFFRFTPPYMINVEVSLVSVILQGLAFLNWRRSRSWNW